MKSIFTTPPRITQYYGVNAEYYSQFGNAGHEGLDLVPTGEDWTVLSPFRGTVTRCYESSSYGLCVMIYSPEFEMSTRIAHLSEVYAVEGQFIRDGGMVGRMGNTGNSRGAHVHINMIPVHPNGAKKYPDNGYKGRVDPLPVLEVLEALR